MSQVPIRQQIKRVEFQLRIAEAYQIKDDTEVAEWKAILATLLGLEAADKLIILEDHFLHRVIDKDDEGGGHE